MSAAEDTQADEVVHEENDWGISLVDDDASSASAVAESTSSSLQLVEGVQVCYTDFKEPLPIASSILPRKDMSNCNFSYYHLTGGIREASHHIEGRYTRCQRR